ncbi:hypothetical protein BH18ACI1_BH18ACI1_04010 [soil metagenome]
MWLTAVTKTANRCVQRMCLISPVRVKSQVNYERLLPDYLRFLIVRTVNLQQAAEKLLSLIVSY